MPLSNTIPKRWLCTDIKQDEKSFVGYMTGFFLLFYKKQKEIVGKHRDPWS